MRPFKCYTLACLVLAFSLLISSSVQQGGGYNCANGCCGIPFGSGFCSKCCASAEEAQKSDVAEVPNAGGLFCQNRCCGTWVNVGRFQRCTKCCNTAAAYDSTANEEATEKNIRADGGSP